MCVCVCVCAWVHVLVSICMCVYRTNTTYMCVCVCVCVCVCYIHTCILRPIYIYIYSQPDVSQLWSATKQYLIQSCCQASSVPPLPTPTSDPALALLLLLGNVNCDRGTCARTHTSFFYRAGWENPDRSAALTHIALHWTARSYFTAMLYSGTPLCFPLYESSIRDSLEGLKKKKKKKK